MQGDRRVITIHDSGEEIVKIGMVPKDVLYQLKYLNEQEIRIAFNQYYSDIFKTKGRAPTMRQIGEIYEEIERRSEMERGILNEMFFLDLPDEWFELIVSRSSDASKSKLFREIEARMGWKAGSLVRLDDRMVSFFRGVLSKRISSRVSPLGFLKINLSRDVVLPTPSPLTVALIDQEPLGVLEECLKYEIRSQQLVKKYYPWRQGYDMRDIFAIQDAIRVKHQRQDEENEREQKRLDQLERERQLEEIRKDEAQRRDALRKKEQEVASQLMIMAVTSDQAPLITFNNGVIDVNRVESGVKKPIMPDGTLCEQGVYVEGVPLLLVDAPRHWSRSMFLQYYAQKQEWRVSFGKRRVEELVICLYRRNIPQDVASQIQVIMEKVLLLCPSSSKENSYSNGKVYVNSVNRVPFNDKVPPTLEDFSMCFFRGAFNVARDRRIPGRRFWVYHKEPGIELFICDAPYPRWVFRGSTFFVTKSNSTYSPFRSSEGSVFLVETYLAEQTSLIDPRVCYFLHFFSDTVCEVFPFCFGKSSQNVGGYPQWNGRVFVWSYGSPPVLRYDWNTLQILECSDPNILKGSKW